MHGQRRGGAAQLGADARFIDHVKELRFKLRVVGIGIMLVAAVEEAMKTATPAERAQAARAYLLASRHELEFFDQALRLRAGGSR